MPFLSREKVEALLRVLKQENARSLFLSCLPGDFKRSRVKLDLSHLEISEEHDLLVENLLSGGSMTVWVNLVQDSTSFLRVP